MSKYKFGEQQTETFEPQDVGAVFGLVCLVANLAIVAVMCVLLLNRGDSSDKPDKPDDAKIVKVADQAIKDYAENVARTCEYVAKQVLEKKIHTKEVFSNISNQSSQKARLEAFKAIGEMDNEFVPDEFAGKEQAIADYLNAMAKGHRKAVGK